MPEPRLQPLPEGNLKIHASHFRKVVRRIECIKPLAGIGISLKPTEDGIEISSTVTAGGNGVPDGFSVIELDVCRNGVPHTIQVLGYDPIGYTDL